mmetsp:Transcript_66064/g.137681  ORF Transcript_66064/g.137681 Transcript_66064/m.137681 type:complete len:94 (+) Transcript_66064:47-328(+)
MSRKTMTLFALNDSESGFAFEHLGIRTFSDRFQQGKAKHIGDRALQGKVKHIGNPFKIFLKKFCFGSFRFRILECGIHSAKGHREIVFCQTPL